MLRPDTQISEQGDPGSSPGPSTTPTQRGVPPSARQLFRLMEVRHVHTRLRCGIMSAVLKSRRRNPLLRALNVYLQRPAA